MWGVGICCGLVCSRPGRKLIVYHEKDDVIGAEAALHGALAARNDGSLSGTAVVRLAAATHSPHNDDVSLFEAAGWKRVVEWARARLEQVDGPSSGGDSTEVTDEDEASPERERPGQEHAHLLKGERATKAQRDGRPAARGEETDGVELV